MTRRVVNWPFSSTGGRALLLLILVSAPCLGQDSPPRAPRPRVKAQRIAGPILLDGDLSDPAWQGVEAGTDFTQREPHDKVPATERTELRVAYTTSTLYIAVRAWDKNPKAIIAKDMERDAVLQGDDSVHIVLDTFQDRRNAYSFATNPNGTRTDALITDDGRDVNTEWDGVWDVACRRDDGGWSAELAIPFSTLRFDPHLETWGMNVRRVIRHKNEEVHWAALARDDAIFGSNVYAVYRVSLAGELNGIEGIRPSRRLDVKPFLVAMLSQIPAPGVDDTRDESDFGLDVKWGLGRSLAVDLTYNTDFAEVEVDEQQVNLTRFSLFFPEKRQFFLENAGIFEFGLPNRDEFEPHLMKIFFSRRIGLERGLPVPIDWGGRLTGRVGDWNLGLLNVTTRNADLDGGSFVQATNVGVLRIKRNLGERSGIGFILTDRDEAGPNLNRVYGIDFDYKPLRRLDVSGFLARSDDPDSTGDPWAAGSSFAYRNRSMRASFEYSEMSEGFEPGVGFLLRDNFQRFNPRFRYTPRINHHGIRGWLFEGVLDYFARASTGELESRRLELTALGMRTLSDDLWRLDFVSETERLFEPFRIRPGIVIPAGLYKFESWLLAGRTNERRPVAARFRLNDGEFFGGDRQSLALTLDVRGSRFFRASTLWSHNDVNLPQGDFNTTVWGERLSFSFNPDFRLNTFLQYNDAAELVALNVRLHWIYKPGADLFLVYNENWDAPTFNNRRRQDRQLIFKFTYFWQR